MASRKRFQQGMAHCPLKGKLIEQGALSQPAETRTGLSPLSKILAKPLQIRQKIENVHEKALIPLSATMARSFSPASQSAIQNSATSFQGVGPDIDNE